MIGFLVFSEVFSFSSSHSNYLRLCGIIALLGVNRLKRKEKKCHLWRDRFSLLLCRISFLNYLRSSEILLVYLPLQTLPLVMLAIFTSIFIVLIAIPALVVVLENHNHCCCMLNLVKAQKGNPVADFIALVNIITWCPFVRLSICNCHWWNCQCLNRRDWENYSING